MQTKKMRPDQSAPFKNKRPDYITLACVVVAFTIGHAIGKEHRQNVTQRQLSAPVVTTQEAIK